MDNLLWRRAVEKQETKANIEKTKEATTKQTRKHVAWYNRRGFVKIVTLINKKGKGLWESGDKDH